MNESIPAIYFSNSVKEVFHKAMGLDIIEVKAFSDTCEDVDEQVTGLLTLTGDINMMISLGMPKKTAYALMVYMTGLQLTELKDEDIYDGIAEVVNMIAGQVRTQASTRGLHLKVLIPFVATGNNYKIVYKDKVENIVKRFRMGNLDFLLKVFSYHLL